MPLRSRVLSFCSIRRWTLRAVLILTAIGAMPLKANEQTAAETVSGHYQSWVEEGVYSTMTVEAHDAQRIWLQLDCQYGSPTFNSGQTERTLLTLKDNRVRYHQERYDDAPCTIDVEFSQGKAQVRQVSGHGYYCGFGMKVMCHGEFEKLPVMSTQ